MKIPIKVGKEVFYMDSDSYEKEHKFRTLKEARFQENMVKFFNKLKNK